jgi:anti-sigma regulatory factor (Ser/Thr protein kinase)
MEMTRHLHLEVSDQSGSGFARRAAVELASRLDFDDRDSARLALVVTELATNLVKHGGGGELLLRSLRVDDRRGIGVLSLDRGPGIRDPREALQDGYSTAGTPGSGLGAVRRQSSVFDLYSRGAAGCALLSEIWCAPGPPEMAVKVGGVNVPVAGEEVSGDAWEVVRSGSRVLVLLADGIGHGAQAAAAARAAVIAFRERAGSAPAGIVEAIHRALRATRGAAVAVAELDLPSRLVRFAGIGNIAGAIVSGSTSRSLVSHYGTAGHEVRRIQEFQYPWPAGANLVLNSDGLISRWTLDAYPGLERHHPGLAAGILYRDFRRARDDTSVVIVGEAA